MWWCAAALAAEVLTPAEMQEALTEVQDTLHAVHPEPFAAATLELGERYDSLRSAADGTPATPFPWTFTTGDPSTGQ